MTIRRSAAAAAGVALGLLALSACSKPTALATVTVGKNSVNSQASCYRDGKALTTKEFDACVRAGGGKTVTVGPTDFVHIGVEPAIADQGWVLLENGQPISPKPMKETYRSFSPSTLFADGSPTSSISLVEVAGNSAVGVWKFQLKQAG